MSAKRYRHAHPLTKTAQGLLLDLDADTDSQTWRDLSDVLTKATEAAKDIEEDRTAVEAERDELAARLRGLRSDYHREVDTSAALARRVEALRAAMEEALREVGELSNGDLREKIRESLAADDAARGDQ